MLDLLFTIGTWIFIIIVLIVFIVFLYQNIRDILNN